jgi:uncharacterized repeat protein (TIGR03803 family)
LTTLVSFNVDTGSYPVAGLTAGNDGNFYGTTQDFYAEGRYGTVFKVTPGGVLTTLVSFKNSNSKEPKAGLTPGRDGNFYGTTYTGGSANLGTVFKVTPDEVFTTLVSFNNTNGSRPRASLTQGSDGYFYGTTETGGAYGFGTIFKMTFGGILITLHSFDNYSGNGPTASLTQGSDGNFYGTARSGGSGNNGTIYKMTPSGGLTKLVDFLLDQTNGSFPQAGLTQGNDGNFYGTTSSGGTSGYGTVFKMTPAGALTTLRSLNNGRTPAANLTLGSDGNFYGTTLYGGTAEAGTVFRITPGGVLTTLVRFNGTDGGVPLAGVTQGSDGNFYGTTRDGGVNGAGTIFKMTAAGQLTTLHSFDSAYAAKPWGAPVFDLDGNLYGTADKMVIWRFNPVSLTPVQSWRMENFGTADNAAAAANSADPDADGVINVLELAFGTDPNDAVSGPRPLEYIGTLAGGGTVGKRGQPVIQFDSPGAETAQVLFMRRKDYTTFGLTYVAEFSSDLSTWAPGTASPKVLASDSVYEIVSVPDPAPATNQGERFARVRVALAP